MSSLTDLFSLDGKVVIVTGASSGLGVAFAQGFAEAGADVVLGARRTDKLADTAKLVEDAGRRAIAVARQRAIELRRDEVIGDDAYRVLVQELDWAELSAGGNRAD